MVIMNMGPVQMYLISLCSSKMKKLLKKYISQIKFTLHIEVYDFMVFIVKSNDVNFGLFFVKSSQQKCPYTDTKLFAHGDFDKLTTFWGDVFHGASRTFKKLLDRFPCQVRNCSVRTEQNCFDIRRVLRWANTLRPKFTEFTVKIQENVTENHYSYVIKSLEQLHSVNIYLIAGRHYNTVDIDMKGKRFIVCCADWITLDHLIEFDGAVMCFVGVQITDKNMNTFLKAYIQNETSGNLEYMSLTVSRSMDIDVVLDGLVWSNVETEDVRMFGKYGTLAEMTNENCLRIVMKNREICYLRVDNSETEGGELLILNWKDEVFTPFRLRRLPDLALEHVIKRMDPLEAFNLSICSRKIRNFVKQFFKNQKIKLFIEIADCFLFRLVSTNGTRIYIQVCEYPEVLEGCMKMKIGNSSRIPFYFLESHVVRIFWRDIVQGASQLYPQILELFNIHFDKLHVMTKSISINYGSVIGWMNRTDLPFEHFHFDHGSVDDALYSRTIQSVKLQDCNLYQKPSENFHLPEFRFTNAHVNWQVLNSHWITLENLSEIGSVCLVLKDLKFTDQEVNIFLRTLITGKFQNLELLSLGLNRRDISPTSMMDGIIDLENVEENWDARIFDRYGHDLTVEGTIDVQMATGENCLFMFYLIEEEDELQSGVTVVIWK
ncbi:hypothetical protein CAEBREN_02365 [Caenorhabditis brenneri]|uniref:F-box domain-containing protein n=1 Tax=Caenorhabditis brenneri TaxID=135651 RepID=G0NTQ1_CAEBE|nr:hypothetical protein CAEBREN_02365 [Caenorhabditis brenneri]